ncbi:MAG: hypothetical protein HY077_05795 [Elusimicrobia bacterium]|nr:hypothetical protein [Elusimicrobiota bacterium]
MNMLMLVGMASHGSVASNPGLGDSFALGFFIAGFASLATAAYLLATAPGPEPLRAARRR